MRLEGVAGRNVHFALSHGRHKVLLCRPDILAGMAPHTFEMKHVTCPLCYLANEDDKKNDRGDIHKQMIGNQDRLKKT